MSGYFVKFHHNNTLVNMAAIQLINPVTVDRLYDNDETLWTWARYFLNDLYTPKEQEKFGVIKGRTRKSKAKVYGNFVVGYVVHLSAPCGGINNSHETVNISVAEYDELMDGFAFGTPTQRDNITIFED